nr:MAG TPA: hypothetical protein [Caudoviricetes sp.]
MQRYANNRITIIRFFVTGLIKSKNQNGTKRNCSTT